MSLGHTQPENVNGDKKQRKYDPGQYQSSYNQNSYTSKRYTSDMTLAVNTLFYCPPFMIS